jgi:serine/threonine protein kinase
VSDGNESLKRALQGRYTIEKEIGRGGMGVVYLARDTSLDRPVAIKVLPEHLAADAERMARFQREAKLLASVNHPNIAGIHAIEQVEGRHFLILEFVEGQTLGELLARGPLPVKETLQICRQIAGAVETAHENGVIHRDLKPGNIHITPGDEAKVLDFGLAKGSVSTESGSSPENSPTLTFHETGEGVILGTTAYLSPEQARGKAVNRRADIWAFGCILYECLTGRQTFEGETVSDTIAKILEREVDYTVLPAKTPPRVRALLQRCLIKDEKQRLRDIGEARLELEAALAEGDSSSSMRASDSWVRDVVPVSTKSNWARASVFTLVGIVLASAAWILMGLGGGGSGQDAGGVTRFSVDMPDDIQVAGARLMPDGQAIVINGRRKTGDGGEDVQYMLYVRQMNEFEFKPLDGTEGVWGWVSSADGKWIGFVSPLSERTTQKKFSRVPVDGSSAPVTIIEWNDEWGSTAWLANGDFIIQTEDNRSYFRLAAGSNTPGETRTYIEGDTKYSFNITGVLPGDRGYLLTSSSWEEKGYQQGVAVFDLKSQELKFLLDDGGGAKYSPTGHLVFTRGENLLAAPFDLGKLEVSGEPVAVLSGLRIDTIWAHAPFYLSNDGTLSYAPGGMVGGKRTVAIVDASGSIRSVSEETYPFEGEPAVSADGRVFASVVSNANGIYEIWGGELARPRFRKLAAEPNADCSEPVLSPDGRWLAYQRFARTDEDGLYVRRVDGSGTSRRIVKPASQDITYWATGWSADGREILVVRGSKGKQDLLLYPFTANSDAPAELTELHAGPEDEFAASFSPRGGYIAFEMDETGQHEVYVSTYDATGATGLPIAVSDGEGHRPRWSPDGKKLYFGSPQQGLLSVDVTYQPSLVFSEPGVVLEREATEVFEQRYEPLSGDRLLIVRRGDLEGELTDYNVVLNWRQELQQKMSPEIAAR